MRKKYILIIALTLLVCSLIPMTKVEATAGLSLNDGNKQILRFGMDEILLTFDSYQGPSIQHEFQERSNGFIVYYRGTLNYTGRGTETIIPGIGFGNYRYLGYKSKFTIYLVTDRNGNPVDYRPSSLANGFDE